MLRLAPIFLCLSAGLAHAQVWTGTFAYDGLTCNEVGDAQPITIDPDGISFYESYCTFVSVIDGGWGDSWLAAMTCSGEGMTWQRRVILMIDGDALHMWDANDSFLLSYHRC